MSVKTVQRYIWLNDLVLELKTAMDGGKLSFTPPWRFPASGPIFKSISPLPLRGLGAPTQGQAKRMRELDMKKELKPDVIDAIYGRGEKRRIAT